MKLERRPGRVLGEEENDDRLGVDEAVGVTALAARDAALDRGAAERSQGLGNALALGRIRAMQHARVVFRRVPVQQPCAGGVAPSSKRQELAAREDLDRGDGIERERHQRSRRACASSSGPPRRRPPPFLAHETRHQIELGAVSQAHVLEQAVGVVRCRNPPPARRRARLRARSTGAGGRWNSAGPVSATSSGSRRAPDWRCA